VTEESLEGKFVNGRVIWMRYEGGRRNKQDGKRNHEKC
jgi:hypothetical protein